MSYDGHPEIDYDYVDTPRFMGQQYLEQQAIENERIDNERNKD